MSYNQTIQWAFTRFPMFEKKGEKAYKASLENIEQLMEHLGNPHLKFKSIHIAGTNGKGSTSSLIASTFMERGFKTGLYTSPHLVDFRERISINGSFISEEFVYNFIEKNKNYFEKKSISFFEMATAMAFEYFAEQKVDFAIIETGLGGRLDSTNIINPELCVITNIQKDHCNILGNSRVEIAVEKAGIIKKNTPIVIGECDSEIESIFKNKAKEQNAQIFFAENLEQKYECELKGDYQKYNIATSLKALEILSEKFNISKKNIEDGFKNVVKNTKLRGRWQILSQKPLIVCDTAHNPAGIKFVVEQILKQNFKKLHIVLGMVKDKDITSILELLPKDAEYYFCKADLERALDPDHLIREAKLFSLNGKNCGSTKNAFEQSLKCANIDDMIFVGGSTFVVGEILKNFYQNIL